jgi:hypothetical protein
MPSLFSKSELLKRGWTERQIGLALDEADEYGPSNHWLNEYGEPFYDADRVEIAAHYLGISGFPKPTKETMALSAQADETSDFYLRFS